MSERVRIVLSAELADLQEPIAGALKAFGMDADTVLPACGQDLAEAASSPGCDLVLADPGLFLDPARKAALDRLCSRAPDTPIAALDRRFNAARSLDAVRAGAHCYHDTEDMTRLPGMVACCLGLSKLLSERHRFRRNRDEFQARFCNLFSNSSDAVVILDDEMRVTDINDSFQRLFRYRPEEAKGRLLGDLIVPEDMRDDFSANTDRVSAGGMVRGETVRRRKDRTLVHVAVVGSPIALGEGIIGAYAIYSDITARIRALEALRRAESKYRSIFEHAVEGMYISTPFGRFVTVNPAMSGLLGYDSPSDLTDNVKSIGREVYAEIQARDEFRRCIEEAGLVSGFMSQVRRKDGRIISVMENVRAIYDDDGELLYFQGTMQAAPGPAGTA